MLSFGQAAFYGIGAYTTALFLKHVVPSLALAMLSCIVVSFLAALAIGFVCVRFTKTYFIMLTIAFAELIYIVGNKWISLTGGDDGLVGIPVPELSIFGLPPVDLQNLRVNYYFALVIVAASAFIIRVIVNSHFGHVLRAIREDRQRAEFLGLDVKKHILICYSIAGLFAGLAGALLIPFEGMVSLETLHFTRSADPIIMSILGGTRYFLGPFVGAALFIFIKDAIQNFTDFWMLWMGVIFVAAVLFFPGGVAGFFGSVQFRSLFSRKKEQRNMSHGYLGNSKP
jgi:branched-chain amino acid transport system permease protein